MSTVVDMGREPAIPAQPAESGRLARAADRAQLHAGAPPTSGTDLPTAIPPIVTRCFRARAPGMCWHDGSQPVVMRALFRPDHAHTSYLAYVAWMDTSRVRFVLHPGSVEPGSGGLRQPDTIPARQRSGLMATFNGGFRLKDALMGPYGGYYADGHRVGRLVNGKAAEIFRSDGSMTVGMWGRDGSLSDPPSPPYGRTCGCWWTTARSKPTPKTAPARRGDTIKNAYYVWRSGDRGHFDRRYRLRDGPDPVRADTRPNPAPGRRRASDGTRHQPRLGVIHELYSRRQPGDSAPTKPMNFSRPADRYYRPSSRDFVAVYAR